jgi:amino acid adenylation domain-containing protein
MKPEDVSSAYWQDQLTGIAGTLTLPLDHRRPPVPSFIKSSLSVNLEESLCRRLESNLGGIAPSRSIILLAAYQALLYRYSGQDDLLVGFLNCRRNASASENGSAPQSNLLAIRASIEGEMSGSALVERTADNVAKASGHASLPFERISEIAVQGNAGTSGAVFDTAFIIADDSDSDSDMHREDFEEYLVQCDLVFSVERKGKALLLNCEYESELFEEDTIARLLSHYRVLLEGMVSHPETQVSHLPLLSDHERRQLLLEDVTNEFPVETCLHELFEDQAARSPEAVAVVHEDEELTYDQLNKLANRVAHRLRDLDVGPDVLVGLCLERSSELIVALVACLKAGGAYLPIDLSYPAERVKFVIDDAQVPVLLSQTSLQDRLPQTDAVVLYVDQILEESNDGHDANLDPVTDPDNLAYVIYTSGTTGNPKGSLVTHRNVLRLFAGTDDWFHFNKDDVWTLFHSCAFDFSVWELWGALLYGGRVVVVPYDVSRSPEAFYDLLAKQQVTVLNQTPSAFRQLIQAEEAVGPKDLALRYVIFGGEALEMQSLKPWFDRHGDQTPRLINMYGITETTVHVTYRLLSKADVGPASVIGVPIPDLQVYILDPHQDPVPIGVAGEMYVGGAGVCRGYLNREELTKQRFIPDPFGAKQGDRFYRTGDLARWLPNGDIEYLRRIDHQVKIDGFRIELGEIESVLCEHPDVRQATVLAREDSSGANRLTAYVVCNQPQPGTSQLRDHLKRKLPAYMVPAALLYLDKLPLTNNGKVDRKALAAPETKWPEPTTNVLAPPNKTEQLIAQVYEEILHVDEVGVHDNFFELGGDSLRLGLVIERLREQFAAPLEMVKLFEYPTIRALAAYLNTLAGDDHLLNDAKQRSALKKQAWPLIAKGENTYCQERPR